MSEGIIINDFTDIISINREIIQKIKSSSDVMEIAELVSESENVRDFTYKFCDNKKFYGTKKICRITADKFYNDIIKIASFKISMLKKRELRERNRSSSIFETGIYPNI